LESGVEAQACGIRACKVGSGKRRGADALRRGLRAAEASQPTLLFIVEWAVADVIGERCSSGPGVSGALRS
jgi:hypothetical protein